METKSGVSERAILDVKEILQKDAEDDSLKKYKETLLGDAAHGDLGDLKNSRKVVVEEFKVVFEDKRDQIVYHLDTREGIEHMKSTQFTLKEGCKYRFIISFRVNRTIVSGLRFKNKAKKAMHSSVDEIMIGSYAPRTLPYTFVYPRHDWIDAPSGMLSRGKYLAQFQFIDDDNEEHLKAFYTFGKLL